MATREYTVLIGDDSEDDRLFMRRILRALPDITHIEEVANGHEVISYLSGTPPFDDRALYPLPSLLLLDLKMPYKTGHEVLRWMGKEAWQKMAVIIVSGSALPADISTSLDLGAFAYHQKSAVRDRQMLLVEKVRSALHDLPRQ